MYFTVYFNIFVNDALLDDQLCLKGGLTTPPPPQKKVG